MPGNCPTLEVYECVPSNFCTFRQARSFLWHEMGSIVDSRNLDSVSVPSSDSWQPDHTELVRQRVFLPTRTADVRACLRGQKYRRKQSSPVYASDRCFSSVCGASDRSSRKICTTVPPSILSFQSIADCGSGFRSRRSLVTRAGSWENKWCCGHFQSPGNVQKESGCPAGGHAVEDGASRSRSDVCQSRPIAFFEAGHRGRRHGRGRPMVASFATAHEVPAQH
jgi:hypothetical protein